jgi:hypothetical protein
MILSEEHERLRQAPVNRPPVDGLRGDLVLVVPVIDEPKLRGLIPVSRAMCKILLKSSVYNPVSKSMNSPSYEK